MEEIIVYIVFFFNSLMCLIPTFFFVCYFPKKNMNKIFKIAGFIFFFYNCEMLMVLPIDIYFTYHKNDPDTNNKIIQTIEEQLTFIYKMNFVVLLWINMLVLQFIINFIQSGYFSTKEKIINVIKKTISLFVGLIIFFLLLSVIINFFEQYEYV